MIFIVKGGVIRLDVDDYFRLEGRSVYLGNNGYAYFSTNRTGPITLHSFVMGGARRGFHIDHINGDKLDNRKANLRFVTPGQNQLNRKSTSANNTSGVTGVRFSEDSKKNPWQARIMVNKRQLHLGLFPTKEEAVAARRAAELKYFGHIRQ